MADDDRIEEQAIAEALAARSTSASLVVRDAVARLATGLLRQFHIAPEDPILGPLKTLVGVDEKEQCAQVVTDWYLAGRRDIPPFLERPQFQHAISNLFAKAGATATDTEVTVLVNVLVGLERDALLAPSPAGRMVIAGKLFDAYGLGAA
jgi:hypothetical protein